ncbi:probable 3-ketoacyl-CoA synthase 21 [Eucalyptus grandis]|uniref:probable 3-ketoacyl-CoA synthase 21 n=1 Tax=Eucalyptus grandis TaxID=71139 RepID=UPI00192EE65E|nr:probable 3-ketoacyl-CoA synthase 21 [Eucalyptus grandis]
MASSGHVLGLLGFVLAFAHRHFPLAMLGLVAIVFLVSKRKASVYLLDFNCYKAPDSYRLPKCMFREHLFFDDKVDPKSKAFLIKIFDKSGYSEETCIPPSITELPIKKSLSSALEEAETVIFSVVHGLLRKNNVSPRSIDILICNSTMFCPTPSLTAMVVNKFGMRSNIQSYNLSGMGCSAGVVSVGLARDLLRVHRNSLALIVSTEILNMNWYTGKNASMLITNCLFRMGSAALLLSSRDQDKKAAKYELQHLVRTTRSRDEQSYTCVYQDVDSENEVGVSISKSIVNVAGDALKSNMASLGPLVLPYTEQCRYAWSLIKRKLGTGRTTETYVPNFRRAFEHFFIHAGGKSIIEAIGKNLKLGEEDLEASKMTLYKFGNTSASSIWYELAYTEAKGRVKAGDRIWQIALGSGFKCNSAVWRCINPAASEGAKVWEGKMETDHVEVP